jgi:hypothetical protein
MMQSTVSRERQFLVSLAILGCALGAFLLLAGAGTIVVNRPGGSFNVVLLVLAPAIGGVWLGLLLTRRLKWALGMYLIMLPGLFRVQSVAAIVAYVDSVSGWNQRISATTIALLALTVVVLASKVRVSRTDRTFRLIEMLLWGYAIFGTASQLLNHEVTSAILLSVGAFWQFVALFYLVDRIVEDEGDVRFVLQCLLFSVIVNIFVRAFTEGTWFFATGASVAGADSDPLLYSAIDYQRTGGGSNPFGFAVSYGGYLAFSVPIALYMLRSSSRQGVRRTMAWALAVGLIILELLSTFTRGAALSLLLIPPLLLLWKSERRVAVYLLMSFVTLMIIAAFLPPVQQVLVGRGLFLDERFLQIEAVSYRLDLVIQSLDRAFDHWGFGYGIGNELLFYVPDVRSLLTVHNLTLGMTQSVGAISTAFFIGGFLVVMYSLFRVSQASNAAPNLSAYLFVALAIWLFFANTTAGVSLTYYYPYETMLLFYTVLFVASALCRNVRSKTLASGNIAPGHAAREINPAPSAVKGLWF